jgi:hypothetical protein
MSERTHAELLISRTYAQLSTMPKEDSQASVSLASIGSYEVRMFLRRGPDLNGVPQFWLELFDHGTRRSVDSYLCHRVKDAAPIFEEFMSHAAYLNKLPPDGSKEQ